MYLLTNRCNFTLPLMESIFDILHDFKSFCSLLNAWVGTIELENFGLGIQNKYVLMIKGWTSKRNLIVE
jgi:hypothetical protein